MDVPHLLDSALAHSIDLQNTGYAAFEFQRAQMHPAGVARLHTGELIHAYHNGQILCAALMTWIQVTPDLTVMYLLPHQPPGG